MRIAYSCKESQLADEKYKHIKQGVKKLMIIYFHKT